MGLIAPAGYHRTVFGQRLRPQLVNTGHRYAIAGLVLLLLAPVGAVQLAARFVVGAWATLLAGALAGLFVLLWFVIPWSTGSGPSPGMGTRRSIGAWPGRPPISPTSRAESPW